MITNETRAALIQPGEYRIRDGFFEEMYCDGHWECGKPPAFDTDANAVVELRKFVRARGKEADFAYELRLIVGSHRAGNFEDFDLLNATPAQQTAAFDAVFAERIVALLAKHREPNDEKQ